jgi:hypothetical protein
MALRSLLAAVSNCLAVAAAAQQPSGIIFPHKIIRDRDNVFHVEGTPAKNWTGQLPATQAG